MNDKKILGADAAEVDTAGSIAADAASHAVAQAKEAVLKAGDKLTSIWDVTKANGWTQLAEGVDALIAAVRAEEREALAGRKCQCSVTDRDDGATEATWEKQPIRRNYRG